MTKEQFNEYLSRAGVDPEIFWNEVNSQGRASAKTLPAICTSAHAAHFIDSALSWVSTSQGHEYWQKVKADVSKLTNTPIITCCIWNGHPLYCRCGK